MGNMGKSLRNGGFSGKIRGKQKIFEKVVEAGLPGKRTQLWIITSEKSNKSASEMGHLYHSYVSLPEGNLPSR